MIVKHIYRYFGTNGSVTTGINLDYPHKIELYRLLADDGKLLLKNDGTTKYQAIIPIDELSLWSEIDKPQQDN